MSTRTEEKINAHNTNGVANLGQPELAGINLAIKFGMASPVSAEEAFYSHQLTVHDVLHFLYAGRTGDIWAKRILRRDCGATLCRNR